MHDTHERPPSRLEVPGEVRFDLMGEGIGRSDGQPLAQVTERDIRLHHPVGLDAPACDEEAAVGMGVSLIPRKAG